MRIRAFELADYEAAHQLWAGAEHVGPVSRPEVEQKLGRDPQLFLVAELDERDEQDERPLVGVVMGSSDGRRGWIFRLTVDPAHRGEGIGRALVAELEERFLEIGITRVNLLVLSDNEQGRGFWERLGYDGFEVALHAKQLAPSPGSDGSAC